MNKFDGANVLITGGTGSIGGELLSRVLQEDIHKVIVFSRDEIKHFMLRQKYRDPRIINIVGDIRDKHSVERLFYNHPPDIVYHAAAMKHVDMCEEFPCETAMTNIIGTQNVVDAADANDVETLVTISTDKSVSPVNVLGATKLVAERITLNADYTCVRFGNVAGTRGSVIPVFVENVRNHLPINITDTRVTRFLIEKKDATDLVLKATELSDGGSIYIMKMKAFNLADLAGIFQKNYGSVVSVTGIKPGERLHEDLLHETEYANAFEIDNFYVVRTTTDEEDVPVGKKYSSFDAGKFTIPELESIVERYLKSEEIIL
jgi:UDP-N-acetylglucosamine 4,6-dehydratase/5-epimerase